MPPQLMQAELKSIIEALLLASDTPLSVKRIRDVVDADGARSDSETGQEARHEMEPEIEQALTQLQQDCAERSVELRKVAGGYRYQTRPQYAAWISKLHATRPPRLSRALLETLAIIAYRQPVTRGDIEQIRGVSVATDTMRRLQEREWIREAGHREAPGHPALWVTTDAFLRFFGLVSLEELPSLPVPREISEIAREVGMENAAADNPTQPSTPADPR